MNVGKIVEIVGSWGWFHMCGFNYVLAGEAQEFVKQFIVSMDPVSPEGQSPTWLAYHENRMVSVNDFQADPMTVPWHNNHESAFGWGTLLCHSHFI